MLYICIPSWNEAPTIGLLLWRIRKTFQSYSREYEILVYDDGSTDDTTATLAPYAEVAPLTVIRGERQRGYGAALEALAREAARRTRYPRRDAMIVMQGDFTDQPEHLPELIRRFEGGADIVLTERGSSAEPPAVRRLRKLAAIALRLGVQVRGIADPFASYRVIRITLLRELIKASGDRPLLRSTGWAANVELLLGVMPHARRVEVLELAPRYDLRTRATRVRPFSDALAVYRFARSGRGRALALPAAPSAVQSPGAAPRKPRRERATS